MGPEEYLAGHGCGSSYLLELFIDYGYLGICVFSLGLGYLLLLGPEAGQAAALFSDVAAFMHDQPVFDPQGGGHGFPQLCADDAVLGGSSDLLRGSAAP